MPEPSYWDQLVAAAKSVKERVTGPREDVFQAVADRYYGAPDHGLGPRPDKSYFERLQSGARRAVGKEDVPDYTPPKEPTFSDGTPAFTASNAVGLSPEAQKVNEAIRKLKEKIPQGGTDGNWVDKAALNASKGGPGKYVQEKLLNPVFDRARASIPNDMELPDDGPGMTNEVASLGEVTGYAPTVSPAAGMTDEQLRAEILAAKAAHDARMRSRVLEADYMPIVHKSPYSE